MRESVTYQAIKEEGAAEGLAVGLAEGLADGPGGRPAAIADRTGHAQARPAVGGRAGPAQPHVTDPAELRPAGPAADGRLDLA